MITVASYLLDFVFNINYDAQYSRIDSHGMLSNYLTYIFLTYFQLFSGVKVLGTRSNLESPTFDRLLLYKALFTNTSNAFWQYELKGLLWDILVMEF